MDLTPDQLYDYTVRGWDQLRPEYREIAKRIFGWSPAEISVLEGVKPPSPRTQPRSQPQARAAVQWDYPGLTDQPTRGDLDTARRKLGSFDGRLMQWGGVELGPTENQITRQTWTEKGDREQDLMRRYQADLEKFWRDYYGQQIDQGNAWEQSRANIMAGASPADRNFANYGSIRGQQPEWESPSPFPMRTAPQWDDTPYSGYLKASGNTPDDGQLAPWGYREPLSMLSDERWGY